MHKRGMIVPQSLLGIILGAAILTLILLPITFVLLDYFKSQEEVCSNAQEMQKITQVLNEIKGQERTIAWHQEGLCRLVGFSSTQQSNIKPDTKWQQKIATGGSWLCLCEMEILTTETTKDMLLETAKAELLHKEPDFAQIPLRCQVEECVQVEQVTKINDKPFSTWGLPQETFLTFQKEGTTLYINKPEQQEEETREPLFREA